LIMKLLRLYCPAMLIIPVTAAARFSLEQTLPG